MFESQDPIQGRAEDREINAHRNEIQALFDVQLEGIIGRIKEQLDWITETGLLDHVVSNNPFQRFNNC